MGNEEFLKALSLLEPEAVAVYFPAKVACGTIAEMSIAISLKRIADAMATRVIDVQIVDPKDFHFVGEVKRDELQA